MRNVVLSFIVLIFVSCSSNVNKPEDINFSNMNFSELDINFSETFVFDNATSKEELDSLSIAKSVELYKHFIEVFDNEEFSFDLTFKDNTLTIDNINSFSH